MPVGFRSPEVSVVSAAVGFADVLCKTSKHMSRDRMIGAKGWKKKKRTQTRMQQSSTGKLLRRTQ